MPFTAARPAIAAHHMFAAATQRQEQTSVRLALTLQSQPLSRCDFLRDRPTLPPVPWTDVICLLLLGLAAGCLGGMLGIGGSIVMIPVLTVLMGRNYHIAQAAAMIVGVFVSVPSMIRHHQLGAVRWDVMIRMLPFGVLVILAGVGISNLLDHELLTRIFGAFLLYVIADTVVKFLKHAAEPEVHEQRVDWFRCGIVGGVTGFFAGLLGVGGGLVAVPLLQILCKLPLRQAIATSSAVICITAVAGSTHKILTLSSLIGHDGRPLNASEALLIAACLAPTAVLGGLLGASLTHALPLKWVRVAFILLLCWASAEMLGLL